MNNKIYNIAIVAGGDSSECNVSLKSAEGIKSFIQNEQYSTHIVIIMADKWQAIISENEKYDIDKNNFSYTNGSGERIKFDFAYITIHGTPGENGILQGYFELLKLPYSTSNVLTAALTFNKFECNQYLKGFGIKVAESMLVRENNISSGDVVSRVGLPCFVKPNAGGSSYGISKVKSENEVIPALNKAFNESKEVIIESFTKGNEFTCGMYKTKEKSVILPVTEIISQNDFFDYGAKYNNESEEITPARISEQLTSRIQELTKAIYEILNCNGLIRVDYIITENEEIYLLEVNITPGMTATSFIPQQVAAAGMTMKEVMNDIIGNGLMHN